MDSDCVSRGALTPAVSHSTKLTSVYAESAACFVACREKCFWKIGIGIICVAYVLRVCQSKQLVAALGMCYALLVGPITNEEKKMKLLPKLTGIGAALLLASSSASAIVTDWSYSVTSLFSAATYDGSGGTNRAGGVETLSWGAGTFDGGDTTLAFGFTISTNPLQVPEPGILALFGIGLLGAFGWRCRKV